MKRKNLTRNALFTSVISLLLCVSMLVGTTFAWFTDSVVSGQNVIAAGNLDVTLEYKTSAGGTWAPVTADTKIFNENALYEPGYTEIVFLRVANAGSLALKYNLGINVYSETGSTNVFGEEFKLSDYIQIGAYTMDQYNGEHNYEEILFPSMFGSRESALKNVGSMTTLADFSVKADAPLLAGDKTAQVTALVLHMPETVGNEANYKTGYAAPKVTLGVNLVATQLVSESDSFGTDYDEDAEIVVVSDMKGLADAAKAGSKVIDAQGANLGDFNYSAKFTDGAVIKNAKFTYFYGGNVEGTVTFENCEFVSVHSYSANFDSGNGKLVFNKCLFDGWSSFGTAITGVEMNNCSFQKSYNYGILRFYQNAVLNNCTFADSFEGVDTNQTGTIVKINNCTGVAGKIFNNGANVGTWIVDGQDISATITSW